MNMLLIFISVSLLSIADSQQCRARFNQSIVGQCSQIKNCQGTLLAGNACGQQHCCVWEALSAPSACLTASNFDVLYNSSRATFLRNVLDSSMSSAGICENCQAKAAFLAIAATMTNNFQTDESTKTDAELAADDTKYGNTQRGDGSRFRRRGFFGIRGRTMYQRLRTFLPQISSIDNPEAAATVGNAALIAAVLWHNPDLLNGESLTNYADGSFYGLSMIWHKLAGDVNSLSTAAKHYSKFLRQLQCGGDLYLGQGPVCRYNATHNGICAADCLPGMQELASSCGCTGVRYSRCGNSPKHIWCCLDTCSQELKMDLGLVLDASGSVEIDNYYLQLAFTKDLLRRANVGRNKTHVGIINYSNTTQTLTGLNTDYTLQQKLDKVDQAIYYGRDTNTHLALEEANLVFSYARGRRNVTEGVTPVLFVVTDGASNYRNATILAAKVLKDQGIIVVSVGVGPELDLDELHAICTPPVSENYFPISNYAALNQKLNQFTSKACSVPTTVSLNTIVTVEIGRDKYKFLKVEMIRSANKILINVTLLNGHVTLFYSFTNNNPKDPADFIDYESDTTRQRRSKTHQVTLVIEKPNTEVDYAYVGIKGMEENNKFQVVFSGCAIVKCNHALLTWISVSLMIVAGSFLL